jgi:hypothetical protein
LASSVPAVSVVVFPVALSGAIGGTIFELEPSTSVTVWPVSSVPDESKGVSSGQYWRGSGLAEEPNKIGSVLTIPILYEQEIELIHSNVSPRIKVIEIDSHLVVFLTYGRAENPCTVLRM